MLITVSFTMEIHFEIRESDIYSMICLFTGESLCVDPIKNSLKLFEKKNILECHPQENVKIYYLKEEYDDDLSANSVYENIATFKWTRNID